MPDARFFPPAGPHSLKRLAELAGAEIGPGGDPERLFTNVAPLDAAGPDDVSFLDNKAYAGQFTVSAAGCGIVAPAFADRAPADMQLLVTDNPYLAYARAAAAFHPDTELSYLPLRPEENIHPSAIVGPDTMIGSGTVVGPNVRIGARCRIAPNVYIGDAVTIGDDCRIGPSVSIRYAIVGSRVTLFAGVRIGEAGFGFARSPKGAVTVPQLGRVVIGDNVEIGANTTIDRGAGPDTVIGAGTRIDNLVQIGHNVEIGQGCILVSLVGIAGSTKLGNGVMVGGQSGVAGHLSIGDGAQIAARSGVIGNIDAGATVCGMPAVPIKKFFRQQAILSRLAEKKES
jgi:UDP-3-O-[3-hydroxymyristoyl] glucosamine N-acyltransferase